MKGVRSVIVTGSNKGIGYAIAENLAGKGWKVIMAVRNTAYGQAAKTKILQKFGNANLQIEHLDVSNCSSVASFVPLIERKYKNIDVLVNNAGVADRNDEFSSEVFKLTFGTNFYGTVDLTQKLLPLISDKGKVITIGSTLGKIIFKKMTNESLKERFRKHLNTKDQLLQLVHQFEEAIKDNTYQQKGWPKSIYAVSKLAINIYVYMLSQTAEVKNRGIQVYSCCPGYVKTDINNNKGTLSLQQGIVTPVFLSELPFELKEELQGGLFYQKKRTSLLD